MCVCVGVVYIGVSKNYDRNFTVSSPKENGVIQKTIASFSMQKITFQISRYYKISPLNVCGHFRVRVSFKI